MKIEVKGLNKLKRDFERLGKSGEFDKIVDQTLAKSAEGTRTRAVEILEEKVYSKSLPEGLSRSGDSKNAKNLGVEKIKQGYRVRAALEYSTCIEFGTGTLGDPSVPHTTKTQWTYMAANGKYYTSHGMKPRPFLQPAFNEYKAKLPKLLEKELRGALKK